MCNARPQLSIVMPVYNEAGQIGSRLHALQPLRGQAELLLVDGGSKDGSAELAEQMAVRVLHSSPGRARQMNQGARQANTGILLFLHVDTCLPDNAIDLILQAVNNGYLWGRFDVDFDSRDWVFRIIAAMMNIRSRLTGIATGDQALFMTRQAFERLGGFPDIALMEDIAISAKLKKLGKPCCLSARVVTSARRWQKHGVLKTILFMWWLRLLYFLGADPDRLAKRYYRGY